MTFRPCHALPALLAVLSFDCGRDADDAVSSARSLNPGPTPCDAGHGQAPVARLHLAPPFGPRGPVPVNAMFTLDARDSVDPEGGPLTFTWELASSSEVLGFHQTTDGLAFSMATRTAQVFARVTVTDAQGLSAQASMTFFISMGTSVTDAGSSMPPPMNRRPTARIVGAPGQNVFAAGDVMLSGATSSDPDGDPLTYRWRVVDRPYGSAAALAGMGASFLLSSDLAGDYAVQLTVTDPQGLSDVADATWHLTLNGTRCVAPLPSWGFTDYQFDVPLLNSDIIRSAAAVTNGKVDLRLQLCAPPFPYVAAQTLTWCLNFDASPDTGGACGFGARGGAEAMVSVTRTTDAGYVATAGGALDACRDVSYDPATNTLRVLFDASNIGSPSGFEYFVLSDFAGRNGMGLEQVPQSASFLGGALDTLGTLPAFSGVSICDLRP